MKKFLSVIAVFLAFLLVFLCVPAEKLRVDASEPQKGDGWGKWSDDVDENSVVIYPVEGGNLYFGRHLSWADWPEEYKSWIALLSGDSQIRLANVPATVNGYQVTCMDGLVGCSSLEHLILPKTLMIFDYAPLFTGCDNLKVIEVDRRNPYIFAEPGGPVYFSNDKGEFGIVAYPPGLSYDVCQIPYGITEIGVFAFADAKNINYVIIPSSVKSIGEYAFKGCSGLIEIRYEGTEEQWNEIEILCNDEEFKNARIRFNYQQGSNSAIVRGDYLVANEWAQCEIQIRDGNILNNGMKYFIETQGYHPFVNRFCADALGYQTAYQDINQDGRLDFVMDIHSTSDIRNDVTLFFSENEQGQVIFLGAVYSEETVCYSAMTGKLNYRFYSNILGCFKLNGSGIYDYSIYYPITVEEHESYVPLQWRSLDEILALMDDDNDTPSSPSLPPTDSSFNESIYRAEYLLENNATILRYYTSEVHRLSMARILLESGEIESKNNLWRFVSESFETVDDASNAIDFHYEQRDVYIATLIKALERQTDAIAENKALDAGYRAINGLYDSLEASLEMKYGFENVGDLNFKKASEAEREKIKEAFAKTMEETIPGGVFYQIEDMMKTLDILVEAADCLEDFVNKYYLYASLQSVSDGMTDVLEAMLANVPDTPHYAHMREAIEFCIEMISEADENFIQEVLSSAGVSIAGKYGFKNAVKLFYGAIVDTAKTLCPAVNIILGAFNISHAFVDFGWNVDEISDQSYKLVVVKEYNSVLNDAIDALKNKFIADPSEKNANAFLHSIELLFGLGQVDFVIAEGLIEALEDANYNKFLNYLAGIGIGNGVNYNEAKACIEYGRKQLKNEHKGFHTNWIYALKTSDPDIYDSHYVGYDDEVVIYNRYTIRCPVDVFVYDEAGEPVAYIDGQMVHAEGNITVSLVGDTKTVEIYDDKDYQIVCEGYDTGTMDITVTEFDQGEESREVRFYDLPVTEGEKYVAQTSAASGVTVEGRTISADFDTDSVGESEQYRVTVHGGYLEQDSGISFETIAYNNQTLTVTAYIPEGYTFVKWESEEAGILLEDPMSATTTIRVTSDGSVKAVFKPMSDENSGEENENGTKTENNSAKEETGTQIVPVVILVIVVLLVAVYTTLILLMTKKRKNDHSGKSMK